MTHYITVLGTGYLGTTHAVCMAELGFEVLGMDIDQAKVNDLANGRISFYEPEVEPLLRKHTDSGRLRFTTSYEDVAAFGDVHFFCVGTPQSREDLATDLTYIHAAADGLAPHLDRPCLVIGKSTVPVGTAASLAHRISRLANTTEVEVAWNPEFLREGHALEDTLKPDRLVAGVQSRGAEQIIREVYAQALDAGTPLFVTDVATAELIKVAANAFLATKISFINAVAEICERTGADVTILADALGYDPRIGRAFLNAGIGFGGGCLPKDVRAFSAQATELGVRELPLFLREIDAINVRARKRLVELALATCDGSFIDKRVAILGAAFKPNSDDVRDSPALNIAAQIQLEGANVRVYDPKATESARRDFPLLHYTESLIDACLGANVVLHLTEWQEFCDMNPAILNDVVDQRRIIDGRNALNPDRWRSAGWTFQSLGRPF